MSELARLPFTRGEHILRILEGRVAPGRPAVALIRHAERHSLPRDHSGDRDASNLLLTPKGHADAKSFGKNLSGSRPLRVFHSASPRAKETATDILEEFRECHPGVSAELGGVEPLCSAFQAATLDEQKRDRLKRELGGGRALLRAWMEDRLPPGVLLPISQARENLMEMLRARMEPDPRGSLQILISHDYTILLLRDWLFSVRFEDAAWPGFLDGLVMFPGMLDLLTVAWQKRETVLFQEVMYG